MAAFVCGGCRCRLFDVSRVIHLDADFNKKIKVLLSHDGWQGWIPAHASRARAVASIHHSRFCAAETYKAGAEQEIDRSFDRRRFRVRASAFRIHCAVVPVTCLIRSDPVQRHIDKHPGISVASRWEPPSVRVVAILPAHPRIAEDVVSLGCGHDPLNAGNSGRCHVVARLMMRSGLKRRDGVVGLQRMAEHAAIRLAFRGRN
jgi:hypothetical protein